MSALGQKRTFAAQKGMSALPPKADMCSALGHVRFVPIADIRATYSISFFLVIRPLRSLTLSPDQTKCEPHHQDDHRERGERRDSAHSYDKPTTNSP